MAAAEARDAIIGALGRDVCEVDSFSEGVSADRSFWRRDAETLTQDTCVWLLGLVQCELSEQGRLTSEVCRAGAVPKQAATSILAACEL